MYYPQAFFIAKRKRVCYNYGVKNRTENTMPKSKVVEKKIEVDPKIPTEGIEKIIEIDEEAVALEDDEAVIEGEEAAEEDEEVLDVEEVDPFNDKWEQ